MRCITRSLVLVFALSFIPACSAFRDEDVRLSPAQVEAVAKAAVSSSRDDLLKAAEEAFGVHVKEIKAEVNEVTGKLEKLTVTLPPAALEAAKAAGGKVAETGSIPTNPTALGTVLVAGAGAAWAYLARRSRLRRGVA